MITPLRIARERRKLTQTEAAGTVGIERSHWSRVETGSAKASTVVAKKIVELFPELTRDQILFPEEYPPKAPKPRSPRSAVPIPIRAAG